MTWIVSMHSGGGSMVEGAYPVLAISCPNKTVAERLERAFGEWVDRHPDTYVRDEWWSQAFEAPDWTTFRRTDPQLLQALSAQGGDMVIDAGSALNNLYKEHYS